MKANQVQIGQVYIAKVSGKLTKVKILRESVFGGWVAENLTTHREIRIRSVHRLRGSVTDWRDRYPSQSERLALYASEQLEIETQQIINRTGGVSNEPITIP